MTSKRKQYKVVPFRLVETHDTFRYMGLWWRVDFNHPLRAVLSNETGHINFKKIHGPRGFVKMTLDTMVGIKS